MREAARRKMWKQLLSMMRLGCCLLLTLNDWPNTMMERAKRRREGKMPVGGRDESCCPDKKGEGE